jgi:lysophospholipase L1-like esterase
MRLLRLIAMILAVTPLAAHAQSRSFRLSGAAAPGEIAVAPDHVYAGDYGFETPGSRFSVAVPDGNYRVTIRFGDAKLAGDTTVKAEARRLMAQDVRTAPGKFATRSFVVNVRSAALPAPPENAPGGSAVRLNAREAGSPTWDEKLTLEFTGPAPRVASVTIEPVTVPTVFLFGDSTVTDQRCEPGASWGQMLPVFFGPGAAIANHAESGETLKSFLTELRLDKALSFMKPGDFALIQFGHNDQKANWPQTYVEAATTYRAYLRTYIAEVRRKGATPLLVTSPDRRNFNPDGRIRSTLADYAEAVRAVAAEEKVALIDLNAASIAFYQALGPEKSPLAFGNGGKDATHHNVYGAYILARAVVEGIRGSGSPLAGLLAPGLAPFDPAHPMPPEAFHLAPSAPCADRPRITGS